MKRRYAYDSGTLALDTETISYDLNNDGTFDFTRVLDREPDIMNRDGGWQLTDGSTTEHWVGYQYDTAGRMGQVASPAGTFTYGYTANSGHLIAGVTGPVHTVTNTWDPTRDVLTLKENEIGGLPVSSYDYEVNAIGRKRPMKHL